MSKQDIEKRLGFAAQGVKETTRTSAKAKFEREVGRKGNKSAMIAKNGGYEEDSGWRAYVVQHHGAGQGESVLGGMRSYSTEAKAIAAALRGLETSGLKASRPGVKAKMALTIYTVGAKNACYEALANLKALAQLASETNSGWDFHVTVMTDHVKNAMSQLESSPAQAGRYLERAIDTLGMLRKIDPVRLNDIQKGSLKQLIGYVAKSLRDARANIKVVTTASRPGVKAKFADAALNQIRNNAAISDKILTLVSKGLSVPQAIDSVLGEGTYKRIGSEVYDELKKAKSSRPGVKAKMASGWSGKTAKLNRYGDFAVVAAGENGYAKGFANRTQAQAFSDKHNLGGVKFPSSGGRSFYVYVEAPKDSESTTASRPGVKAKA